MTCKTPLSWRFCGSRFAYIYAIYSINCKLCYIGQTNDRTGIIGRLSAHLDSRGTFREHFEKIVGLPIDDVEDLYIISENLNNSVLFTSSTSSYREGVEYLVKHELMKMMAFENIFLQLVGETRSVSTTSLDYIKSEAQIIAKNMFNEIKKDYTQLLLNEN
jgi:hypothetical protein